MRFKEILLTITLSGLLMFMFSCHCNEPKVGTITGNVVLYNDTDSTKGRLQTSQVLQLRCMRQPP